MRGDHKDSERTDRHSSRVASAASPVQKSPNTPKKAHFSQFCTSRENFVPHQQPNRYKTLPAQPVQALTRYKTLPTRPRQQPNRYKTLPTRPKRPISASFARAGRTLYRFHHHDPQQGELCTALTITMPSRENFVPRPAPNPVQNSPNTPTPAAQPVQNSPNTPKIADFSPFYPSRENFVPLSPPRPQQGELSTAPSAKPGTKLSQHAQKGPFQPVLHEQGELCTASTTTTPAGRTLYRTSSPTGTKLSPFSRSIGPTGTKLSQHTPPAAQPVQNSPHTPKKAHFSPFCPSRENFVPLPPPCPPAGRTLYRFHPHDPQQGELCTAPRANPGTKLSLLSRSRRSPGTKLSPLTHTSSPPGTKLSPHTHKGPFQPVLPEQGELCTALTPTPPSRENFVPLSPSRCPAGRTLYRAQRQTRYKTPPTRTVPHPCRE